MSPQSSAPLPSTQLPVPWPGCHSSCPDVSPTHLRRHRGGGGVGVQLPGAGMRFGSEIYRILSPMLLSTEEKLVSGPEGYLLTEASGLAQWLYLDGTLESSGEFFKNHEFQIPPSEILI